MKSITRTVLGLLAIAALLLLGGCASSGPARDINDPTNSLVFAYIDMEDAPTEMSYANIRQVYPKGEEGFWGMGVDEGMLFNQYLPAGGYQMANFGGSGFWSGQHEYSFPTYGRNVTAVRADKPGIYFLGAYKYVDVETGFFEAGKFNIAPIESPTEKELLQRIAEMDWVKGTQWEERIRARLAELGR